MDPKVLRYATTHEWAHLDGDTCTVGITKFAVEQLTDVVYLDLPKPGARVTKEKRFGEIESVKAVSDLFAPVDGEVTAVNDKLVKDPGAIAADPYGNGWMIKIKVQPATNLNHLLTLAQYEEQIASAEH